MKKSILIAALGLFSLSTMAQDAKPEEGFVFTTVKENPITSIKNQNRSSTCWSFSALGFLESELLRLGKGEYDLSEMFVVHKTMEDRGTNYVRYHGDSSFSPGGSFYDIIYCMKNYGLVPQEAMPGIMYGDTLPVHNELDAVAEGYINAIGPERGPSPAIPTGNRKQTALRQTASPGRSPNSMTGSAVRRGMN